MPQMLSFHAGRLVIPATQQIYLLQAMLDALPDGEARVHLFVGGTEPGVDSDVADFVEADFDGYAPIDQIPTPPAINPEGWAQSDVPTSTFTASGGTTPNLVTGFYVTDNTDAVYLGGGRFPAGLQIDEAGDYLTVDFSFQLPDPSQVLAP